MIVKCLLYLFIVGLISQVFFINLERVFFINEIYSLAGILLILKRLPAYLGKPQGMVIHLVFFLLLYGFVYAIYSYVYLNQGTNYEFLRTLPIWYSIAAFFLGLEFSRLSLSSLGKVGQYVKRFKVFIVSIFVYHVGAGPITYSFSSLILLLGRAKWLVLILFSYYAYLWLFLWGKATSPAMFSIYLMILISLRFSFIQRYILLNVKLHTVCFLSALFLLQWVYFEYIEFYTPLGFNIFGADGDYDGNAMWRVMFWAYGVVNNIFPNFVFGTGFGVPLFDMSDPAMAFILKAVPDDPELSYTIGMHNSYLTYLSRLGLIGFLSLMLINYYLFKPIIKYRLLNDPMVFTFFVVFLLLAFAALMHVVLESPIYAGTYWIFCGLLFGVIQSRLSYVLITK